MTYQDKMEELKNDPTRKTLYCKRCKIEWKYSKPGSKCLKCFGPLTDPTAIPKCPTCSSINIVPVSKTKREFSAFLFGIANPSARAQFECKNCGYKW